MSNISKETIAEAINNPNFSFIESFADAEDSAKVTREMTRLLFMHRSLRGQLRVRERERVVLDKEYETKKRESYVKHNKTSATEKSKAILVDIDTENEQYNLDIIDQKIKEINRELSAIKLEIDTWKSISYNLRTEMGSF